MIKREQFQKKVSKRTIIIAVLSVILTLSLTYIGYYEITSLQDKAEQQKMSSLATAKKNLDTQVKAPIIIGTPQTSSTSSSSNDGEDATLSFYKSMKKKNSDMIGWVSIDGTNISSPVMFTPKKDDYYLHRSFEKKYLKCGLPFLDPKTKLDKSSNYIIYGHNMSDGTAFSDLNKYCDESFYKQHKIIHFDTTEEKHDYEIIGVMLSQVYNDTDNVFKYYTFNYKATQKQYNSFVEKVKEHSLYDADAQAKFPEKLLTLSTCSYHTQDGRLAVVAKLIR